MLIPQEEIRPKIKDICYRAARKWSCDPAEVHDDVAADLVVDFPHKSRIDHPERYLRKSAYHQAIRVCQRLKPSNRDADWEAIANNLLTSTNDDPLAQIIRAEEHDLLEKQLACLDRESRRAVDVFFRIRKGRLRPSDYHLKNKALVQLRAVLCSGNKS